MRSSPSLKKITVEVICLLYILLFIYAALSKLLDFESFKRQLFMSPVLTSHAEWLVWAVPIVEILISLLLSFSKTRIIGFFFGVNLMVMFTTYIYLIINYASHIPCSCGGILEDLGWQEHLIFNSVFVVFALVAITILINQHFSIRHNRKKLFFSILVIITGFFTGIGGVVKLYQISEQIVHHENRFQRRFPHPSVTEMSKANLHFNSYYIAGIHANKVFLGNYTAPLHILIYDPSLINVIKDTVQIDTTGLSFNGTQLRVTGDKFYLYNGTVPYAFVGSTSDWRGTKVKMLNKRFTIAEPSRVNLIIRTFSTDNGDNVLGTLSLDNPKGIKYAPQLLKPQTDGIFDTDGSLLTYGSRFVYIYRYRNEFIVGNTALEQSLKGKTIDTISRAKIKVVRDGIGPSKFEKVPLIVNKSAALYKNLLFVNSDIAGKSDSDKLWKQASIIDVYDVSNGSYRFSFPLYDMNGNKMESFRVYKNHIYVMYDNWIVRYDIRDNLLKDYENIPGQVQGLDRKPVTE